MRSFNDTRDSVASHAVDRRSLLRTTALAGGIALTGAMPAMPLSAQEGGTLIIDLGSEPENLDPQQRLAGTTRIPNTQTYESLVRAIPGSLDVEPWLADEYSASDDGLTWTFHIRQGVTFHDGTPLDAEAVKFNFDRQFDPENEFYPLGQWRNATYFNMIESCTVIDAETVEMQLSEVSNTFEFRLTEFSVVSPTAVAELRESFADNPVGTGPFRFDRWDRGQQVVLARYEDYWGEMPALEQVVFRHIAEAGSRAAALLSGETHVAVEITPEIVQQLNADDGFEVVTGQTGALWYLAMNVNQPHFGDVRVRHALNYAVDKETIVSAILNDTAEIAHGPLAPAYQEYNPEVENYYTYDPDRARELLAEAGWDESLEVTFFCSIGGSGMLSPEEMATFIQDNLRDVGFNASIVTEDFVTWMDTIRSERNDLTVMSWNTSPAEPDPFFNGILSEASLPPGFNTSYWVNEELESLLEIGRTSLDRDEVNEAYHRAQMIVLEEAPIVPVCHRQQLFGVSGRVQGFEANPSLDLILTSVTIEN